MYTSLKPSFDAEKFRKVLLHFGANEEEISDLAFDDLLTLYAELVGAEVEYFETAELS